MGAWQRRDGSVPWWSPSLEGQEEVHIIYTTRQGGVSEGPFATLNLGSHGDEAPRVEENRRRLWKALGWEGIPWVRPFQVHGAQVEWVSSPKQPLPPADGLLTNLPGVALGILVADCVPLLIVAPERRVIGAVHVGWRGLVAGILPSLLRALGRARVAPQECWFWLGPCIGPCCYEVGEELAACFRQRWGEEVLHRVEGRKKAHLSLPATIRNELVEHGVPEAQIQWVGLCTACRLEEFFSHRRDGPRTGRQAGLILWQP